MSKQINLVGGPMGGHRIDMPKGKFLGDTIEVATQVNEGEQVNLETRQHYRLQSHPTEGVIGGWVNPADRNFRQSNIR